MASRVFLTGGGGFVGSRLIPALIERGHEVVALDRASSVRIPASGRVQVVRGDLLEPAAYRDALASSDVVLHLAATTGRASRAEHIRVNAEGTASLVDQCRRSGVHQFLFVSSIAVTFDDLRDYHYARAKLRAEAAVRDSGLKFTILRPTMILGAGSPILGALGKLASLPVIPVFGSGKIRVQPVHVDDVVAVIVEAVGRGRFQGETLEFGGPSVLTMEALLQRLRRARTGRRGRVLHVPLGLVLPPLRVAEAVGLGAMLPLSAGQLSSFRSPGTARPTPFFEARREALADVPDSGVSADDDQGDTADRLRRECRVLTLHLLGTEPDSYVEAKYIAAHGVLASLSGGSRFDDVLVNVASRHPIGAKIADSYARIFAPASTLRQKLVLLLAILETSSPSCHAIDAPPRGGRAWLLATLMLRGGVAIVSLLVGTLLLAPARLALAFAGRGSR